MRHVGFLLFKPSSFISSSFQTKWNPWPQWKTIESSLVNTVNTIAGHKACHLKRCSDTAFDGFRFMVLTVSGWHYMPLSNVYNAHHDECPVLKLIVRLEVWHWIHVFNVYCLFWNKMNVALQHMQNLCYSSKWQANSRQREKKLQTVSYWYMHHDPSVVVHHSMNPCHSSYVWPTKSLKLWGHKCNRWTWEQS
jgi:hypothetical protein